MLSQVKIDVSNCIEAKPNIAILFDPNSVNPEVECEFGWGVRTAVAYYSNESLQGYKLFDNIENVVVVAQIIKEIGFEYWRCQYLIRDIKETNDLFEHNPQHFIRFLLFIKQYFKTESFVVSKSLWLEFQKETKLWTDNSLNIPVVTIAMIDNCQIDHMKFFLTSHFSQILHLYAHFKNNTLWTISDWQTPPEDTNIVYPQHIGEPFYLQGIENCNGDEYLATEQMDIKIKGFKEFWTNGFIEVKCFFNREMDMALRSNGYYLKEQRHLLSDEMKALAFLPTINFHIKKECNMKCRHCFAEFKECQEVDFDRAKQIVEQIAQIKSFKKINFSGGEPTLFKGIEGLMEYAKSKGLKTSIVTNGSVLFKNKELRSKIAHATDILALSIDSFDSEINKKIGRVYRNKCLSFDDIQNTIVSIRKENPEIKIKINTVVTKTNCNENLYDYIAQINPVRWKIMRMMPIEGEYDNRESQSLTPTDAEFQEFINKNKPTTGIETIIEDTNAMKGSYIMIAPDGRFFSNTEGKHKYSVKPIYEADISTLLNSLPMSRQAFYDRKGEY